MDTSQHVRFILLGILFVAALAIVFANLRLAALLIARRKVSRLAKILWPALGLLLALCVFDAVRVEPNWIWVSRHTIETSKLPPGARIRVVQLADIHLQELGVREIQMANRTLEERPDVIVLTGDQCVVKTPEAEQQLRDIAAKLSKIAPTYAIEGNWDVTTDMITLTQGGVRLLDGWTEVRSKDGRARIALNALPWNEPTVEAVPREWKRRYTIGLRHIPNAFPEAARAGYDLLLCGHTHGGQVRLPIFGALLPRRSLVGKYQAGMYELDGCLMYVSRGVGLEARPAPQVRFCCPPEIAVFDIVGKRG